jgi:hypothetical protein
MLQLPSVYAAYAVDRASFPRGLSMSGERITHPGPTTYGSPDLGQSILGQILHQQVQLTAHI